MTERKRSCGDADESAAKRLTPIAYKREQIVTMESVEFRQDRGNVRILCCAPNKTYCVPFLDVAGGMFRDGDSLVYSKYGSFRTQRPLWHWLKNACTSPPEGWTVQRRCTDNYYVIPTVKEHCTKAALREQTQFLLSLIRIVNDVPSLQTLIIQRLACDTDKLMPLLLCRLTAPEAMADAVARADLPRHFPDAPVASGDYGEDAEAFCARAIECDSFNQAIRCTEGVLERFVPLINREAYTASRTRLLAAQRLADGDKPIVN